jgi:hypothetical protein
MTGWNGGMNFILYAMDDEVNKRMMMKKNIKFSTTTIRWSSFKSIKTIIILKRTLFFAVCDFYFLTPKFAAFFLFVGPVSLETSVNNCFSGTTLSSLSLNSQLWFFSIKKKRELGTVIQNNDRIYIWEFQKKKQQKKVKKIQLSLQVKLESTNSSWKCVNN